MAEAAIDYEAAKAALKDDDPRVRRRVAADPRAPGEFLFFLAGDPAVEVRRAVAENPSTPSQADAILARDPDYGVRCAVARKAVGEGLADRQRRDLWRMGFTILETLACDQLVRVRRILTEAFKAHADAPPDIVRRLARDSAQEVAAPVLRNSPVLADSDFIDILGADAPDWAQQAIAGRTAVSPAVADALAVRASVRAVAALVANPGAEITEPTMAGIVERAAETPAWHAPLVNRPALSTVLLLRLANFVAAPLLAVLRSREGVDAETAAEIDRVAENRGAGHDRGTRAGVFARRRRRGSEREAEEVRDETPPERALRLHRAGRLTDAVVSAAVDGGEDEFVTAALAARAGFAPAVADRILSSSSPRSVTALCWKAGFGMRFAMEVQRRIARIPPPTLLNARDGLDYPLTPQEMNDQLAFFTG